MDATWKAQAKDLNHSARGFEVAGGSDEGRGVSTNATGGRGARGNQQPWNPSHTPFHTPSTGAESKSQDAADADAAAPLFLRFFLSEVGGTGAIS